MVFINRNGTGAAGAITAIPRTHNGSVYTAAPTIPFDGGGFINIVAHLISKCLDRLYYN
jgi:hypothetical protein